MTQMPQERADVPPLTLGWRIKMAMDHAQPKVTRGEIAALCEMKNAGTVTRWSNDEGAPPKALYLRQIAMRCGVSYDWLAHGSVPMTGPDPDAGTGTTDAYGQARDAVVYRWSDRAIRSADRVARLRPAA